MMKVGKTVSLNRMQMKSGIQIVVFVDVFVVSGKSRIEPEDVQYMKEKDPDPESDPESEYELDSNDGSIQMMCRFGNDVSDSDEWIQMKGGFR